VEAADELIQHVTDETVAAAQKIFSRMDSVGQQRMAQLHGGRRDQLEISPNLWPAFGWCGVPAPRCGRSQTVAARIREYQDVGIDTFIMSVTRIWKRLSLCRAGVPAAVADAANNVTPTGQHRAVREAIGQRNTGRQKQASQSLSLIEVFRAFARPNYRGRRPDPLDRAAGHHPDLATRLRYRFCAGPGAAGAEATWRWRDGSCCLG